MTAAETLAKLHSVVPEDVGLGDYGPRAGYCKRQVHPAVRVFRWMHGCQAVLVNIVLSCRQEHWHAVIAAELPSHSNEGLPCWLLLCVGCDVRILQIQAAAAWGVLDASDHAAHCRPPMSCKGVSVIVQVKRWARQYHLSVRAGAQPLREMLALIDWLQDHIPPGDDDPAASRLSHGDFRCHPPPAPNAPLQACAPAREGKATCSAGDTDGGCRVTIHAHTKTDDHPKSNASTSRLG
jgi:hypothetical protein